MGEGELSAEDGGWGWVAVWRVILAAGGGDDWDDIGGDGKRERRGLMRFPGNGASEYRLCGKS